jgi:hypothetical protein
VGCHDRGETVGCAQHPGLARLARGSLGVQILGHRDDNHKLVVDIFDLHGVSPFRLWPEAAGRTLLAGWEMVNATFTIIGALQYERVGPCVHWKVCTWHGEIYTGTNHFSLFA